MPARDKYHDAVKNALIRDGWTITHDPYMIPIGKTDIQIDLGAEMPIAAERDDRRIAVEIKSFLGDSALNDLEKAIGQYSLYRVLLLRQEPDRVLYLAVPHRISGFLLAESDFRYVLRELNIRFILFDPGKEELVQWIETINTEL
jgi:hypothetical protein